MNDSFGAFVPGETFRIEGAPTGPLSGLTFAAKDVFDVAGRRSTNGQPTWAETHPAAARHAAAVARLLEAGAALAGKTVCDEMCYSLAGDNAHYGAPVNPAARERSTGGSSSGSASAVAGALVDFALGTDCGGSVRCPASFCGIYGIRPTHGRVDDEGVAPLAGSFDVIGWFARDPALLERIGPVLLRGDARALRPARALLPRDAFSRLPDGEGKAAEAAAAALVGRLGLEPEQITLSAEGLDIWAEAFRNLQAFEIWRTHRDWVQMHAPNFGPGVRERFAYAARLTEADRDRHQPVRDAARARLADLLSADDAVVVLPTAPVSARRDASAAEIDAFRTRTMGLTCPAGLTGSPQVSLPLGVAGGPFGISLLGPRGSDEALLALASRQTA
jgi:amidase